MGHLVSDKNQFPPIIIIIIIIIIGTIEFLFIFHLQPFFMLTFLFFYFSFACFQLCWVVYLGLAGQNRFGSFQQFPVSKKSKLELGLIFNEPKIGNQFSKPKPELKNSKLIFLFKKQTRTELRVSIFYLFFNFLVEPKSITKLKNETRTRTILILKKIKNWNWNCPTLVLTIQRTPLPTQESLRLLPNITFYCGLIKFLAIRKVPVSSQCHPIRYNSSPY